jgi:hypothetical protein
MNDKKVATSTYDPTKKQKSAEKTSRIPIKIVPTTIMMAYTVVQKTIRV